jgi:sec-independent protein translocase protein TatC
MADEPLQTIPDPEEEEGGPVKTFLEHLEDLRWVLIRCIVALVLGMVACLAGANYISAFLQRPLVGTKLPVNLEVMGPLGGMTIAMKISLYGGITLALPFLLYFIADYVLPALKKHEKKFFTRAFAVGGCLFLAGMALCYFYLLGIALQGLYAFNQWMHFKGSFMRAEEYYHFTIMFMVGMGLSFEVPVLILALVRLGIIQHDTLVKSRAYLFIGNLVVCAFITPDAVSTIFMVLPVQVLMEICILISKHWDRQKKIAEAAALTASKQVESGAS